MTASTTLAHRWIVDAVRRPAPATSVPLAEFRALVAQGPAVVMASREDFLALLDRVEGAA